MFCGFSNVSKALYLHNVSITQNNTALPSFYVYSHTYFYLGEKDKRTSLILRTFTYLSILNLSLFNCRCKKPSNAMPSKASLPSALVDPTDMPPHSMDSVGRQSKQSSSRSGKPSSNSSKDDGATSTRSFLKPFKNFKKEVVQGKIHGVQDQKCQK